MKRIGLSGNIGSGKSYIADLLEKHGIPVFRADEVGKSLYLEKEVISEVAQQFGDEVLDKQGFIDRKALAAVVFGSDDALKRLSAIIHPRVLKLFDTWCLEQDTELVVMESAIIFEYGLEGIFDKIAVVSAPLNLRLNRVMQRDGLSREEVLNRMKAQWPEDWKTDLADIVIVNDGREIDLSEILSLRN
jgi:dephospho-CoA kinase